MSHRGNLPPHGSQTPTLSGTWLNISFWWHRHFIWPEEGLWYCGPLYLIEKTCHVWIEQKFSKMVCQLFIESLSNYVKMNNISLERVSEIKYLGMIIDETKSHKKNKNMFRYKDQSNTIQKFSFTCDWLWWHGLHDSKRECSSKSSKNSKYCLSSDLESWQVWINSRYACVIKATKTRRQEKLSFIGSCS